MLNGLNTFNEYPKPTKHMVGTALTTLSAAGGLYGVLKSAQANKRIDKHLAKRQRTLADWFDKEYNQNALDTTETQSALGMLRDRFKKQTDVNANTAAVTGASDESVTAAKQGMNDALAGTVSQIAGSGTQRKDSIRREFMDRDNHLQDQVANHLQNKANNWNQMQSNALQLASVGAMADSMGAFEKWDGKIGEWKKNWQEKRAEKPKNLANYFNN
jgi:hypothetical protein